MTAPRGFREDSEARTRLGPNIDRSPGGLRTKYQYFWRAVLRDEREIVQFKEDGSETQYKEVLEEFKNDNVASLWWVPVGQGKSYGVEFAPGDKPLKGLGLFRRAHLKFKQNGAQRLTYAYVVGKENGMVLFIGHNGKMRTSRNPNFDFEDWLKKERGR